MANCFFVYNKVFDGPNYDAGKRLTRIFVSVALVWVVFLGVVLFLAGCTEAGTPTGTEPPQKNCYTFTVTTTTTIEPSIVGYPKTTTMNETVCGLTAAEAKARGDKYFTTIVNHSGDYTITVKQTCKYKIQG